MGYTILVICNDCEDESGDSEEIDEYDWELLRDEPAKVVAYIKEAIAFHESEDYHKENEKRNDEET